MSVGVKGSGNSNAQGNGNGQNRLSMEPTVHGHPRVPGMAVPSNPVDIDGAEFRALMEEGWRFYFDEEGRVISYLAPSLSTRLNTFRRNKGEK